MSNKIIIVSFYLLFFLTPLVWTPNNFELFEYNKMMFVYALTVIIGGAWVWGSITSRKFLFKTTPLDLPLLIFLIANIISTIFSVDRHTSIWGYYTRSNGGLLSTISYLVLYYALVSHFSKLQIIKFFKAAIGGGLVVALWAIPEHFGISPSCIILTGQADAACWVQDVQARVFSTLGQPNWLAAYLAMLIFPVIYFNLTSSSRFSLILNTLYLIFFYSAFTFTYSRGGTLGFLAGLAIFASGYLLLLSHPRGGIFKPNLLHIGGVTLGGFLLINLFFGSALTSFKLVSKFAAPVRPGIEFTKPTATTTQLESGGTESGKIRLIVWRGAWEIFKHYPVFGSGVETFAYTYYNFRPMEHNYVSEWDYLYNKAHNEFLNYLATTGLTGFLSYLAVILVFVFWVARRIKQTLSLKNKNLDSSYLLLFAILAAYISNLVQSFFGFSVVITALFFFLFPGFAFVIFDAAQPLKLPKKLDSLFFILYSILYRRSFYPKFTKTIILAVFGVLLLTLWRYWNADILFAAGNRANEVGNPGRAYNKLSEAIAWNPGEPLYQSELGQAAAEAASVLSEEDASTAAKLKDQAVWETERVLRDHPKNISFFRTAIRTYYYLSTVDEKYSQKTIDVLNQTISLAPTDPKLYYNKALILESLGREAEAITVLQKTIQMKPNYADAYKTLASIYWEKKQKEEAISVMRQAVKFNPGDSETREKLKEWEGEK